MGATTTKTAKKGKVVSFKVSGNGSKRVFTPVNKLAQAFAAVLEVKELSLAQAKKLKKAGLRVVNTDDLKAISL